MSDKTEYHIIKPKIIKNGTNACWINAPLFASSAHEIIILQHFILDNSRLVQGELDITSIFIEKFLNVNRLDNLPWNEQTYLDIYYILSDIAHGNYFFDKTYFKENHSECIPPHVKNIYDKVLPYAFHAIWVFIVLFYFFVTSYFRFQNIYITDFSDFFRIWLLTFLYTMLFILSFQFIDS